MDRRPPRSTRTHTLFPYPTLVRPPWPGRISVAKIPLPATTPSRHIGVLWMRSCPRLRLISALIACAAEPPDRTSITPAPARSADPGRDRRAASQRREARSEEHTSELQSLMRNSYAVFCLKQK